MTGKQTPKSDLLACLQAYERAGENAVKAAEYLGLARTTFQNRLRTAQVMGEGALIAAVEKPFDAPSLPRELPTAEELIERRKYEFDRKDAAEQARVLIPVRVKIEGPIAVVHLGDPHIDDPGTDIAALQTHCRLINETEGMFGANVGDMHNNWVGRLARLYGEQETTAAEAWVLVEWLVTSVNWLYILGGNHDLWSGAGDPLNWMLRSQQGIYEAHGARLELQFPNKNRVRINARHDFSGHSMWNVVHGPAKAIQMGWRDHILTCGHKHTSGYQILKCPASGLVSHAIRCAGYKIHDRYAKELGLPNQNIFPAAVTIIDPQYEDHDPRLVTTLFDVEEGAEYLTWKRQRHG